MSDKWLAFSSIVVTHTLRHEAFHVRVDGPTWGALLTASLAATELAGFGLKDAFLAVRVEAE